MIIRTNRLFARPAVPTSADNRRSTVLIFVPRSDYLSAEPNTIFRYRVFLRWYDVFRLMETKLYTPASSPDTAVRSVSPVSALTREPDKTQHSKARVGRRNPHNRMLSERGKRDDLTRRRVFSTFESVVDECFTSVYTIEILIRRRVERFFFLFAREPISHEYSMHFLYARYGRKHITKPTVGPESVEFQ